MYRALYRKWRPQTFSDVVGQKHITRTLENELKANKLAHAYLFTGSRGTGKTSCAKILAKAVNCENPIDGNPCNECEVCRGIDSGAILDVVEIDAASNNGVDNIRDLREEANYTPVRAKYRVYIIDEVHMLSVGAFNALLKTLEEPPEHVKFILATTEVHKLPATILSRCQRFDFKRIEPEDIAERIFTVAAGEGFSVEREAAMLIARIADGGMRDALSLLDQCAGQSDNVTAELVGNVAGLTGREYLFNLADCILNSDCAKALSILNELHNSSCDMERLCTQLIDHYRNLMIIRSVNRPEGLIVCTSDELKLLETQALKYTLENIMYILGVLEDTAANLRRGLNRRIETEMAFVRLCSPNLDTSVDALIKRVAALETAMRTGAIAAVPPAQPPFVTVQTAEGLVNDEPVPIAPAPQIPMQQAQPSYPNGELNAWADIVHALKAVNPPLASVLYNSTAIVDGERLGIVTNSSSFRSLMQIKSNRADLKRAVTEVTGFNFKLGIKSPSEITENDPLNDFLKSAQDSGIIINQQ